MPDQKRLTPEMLVPRMGEYLVQKGLVSAEDIQRALAHQQEETTRGNSILLGQALIDLNLISRADLDQAVTEQIIQLRTALQASNRSLERRVEERTAELQKALERVSELSQLKANFISNISHELRTPLTHIKGYIELLVTESLGPLTEEQKHALAGQPAIHEPAGDIDRRPDHGLTGFARGIEHQTGPGGYLPPDEPGSQIHAENDAVRRGVHLQTEVDENVPFVQADSQKIAWVLGQLIDNGIKFTPSGGSVAVSHQTRRRKPGDRLRHRYRDRDPIRQAAGYLRAVPPAGWLHYPAVQRDRAGAFIGAADRGSARLHARSTIYRRTRLNL